MVSRTLIHKKVYNIISPKDIPNLSNEEIANVLSSSPKTISSHSKYELDQFPVKFRNVMEGTRKDLTLHYSIKGVKTVYKDPAEFEGIKYYNTISYEESENTIFKVDYVSFFTKPKENINEHRIYQIGPRYSNKEKITLETLLRKYEKEGDITSTINTIKKILRIIPNDYKNWAHLGELLVKTEQYDNAIEACKRAIKLVGIFPDGWICLGMAYYGKGDIEKAKRIFKKTLDDNEPGSYPWYFKALKNLAQIHFNAEDYDNSLEYCDQYIEYDFTEDKRNSKEILNLREVIRQKLGIQEEVPKERTETKESNGSFTRLVQRLYDDNKEYIEYLEHLDVEDLEINEEGKVTNEKALVFCRDAIVGFFKKKFISAFIDANIDKEDFRIFINGIFPNLVSELEVYCGISMLKNLITTNLSKTQTEIYIYLPIVLPEILQFVAEFAFKNKGIKIILFLFFDTDIYGKILSMMVQLGNIQVRQLLYPYSFYGVFRDNNELILAPVTSDINNIMSIRSIKSELINFYKPILLPILNAGSNQINLKESKVVNNLSNFLDDLLDR